MATEDGAVPAPVAAFLYRSLEGLMHGLHALKGTIRMPVALAYFQLENLFVYVFVIAVALKQPYEAALLDSLEATGSAASGAAIRRFGLVRFMASTFVTEVTFLGIRELSIMLADPFGDDAVDLKLDRYLWAATARCAPAAHRAGRVLVGRAAELLAGARGAIARARAAVHASATRRRPAQPPSAICHPQAHSAAVRPLSLPCSAARLCALQGRQGARRRRLAAATPALGLGRAHARRRERSAGPKA